MKKLIRAIEFLIATIAGSIVFWYLADHAPWQVKFSLGILFIITILRIGRNN